MDQLSKCTGVACCMHSVVVRYELEGYVCRVLRGPRRVSGQSISEALIVRERTRERFGGLCCPSSCRCQAEAHREGLRGDLPRPVQSSRTLHMFELVLSMTCLTLRSVRLVSRYPTSYFCPTDSLKSFSLSLAHPRKNRPASSA